MLIFIVFADKIYNCKIIGKMCILCMKNEKQLLKNYCYYYVSAAATFYNTFERSPARLVYKHFAIGAE